MLMSQYFVKTSKEAPKDEQSKNAQLLIRAGYIHKEMAGVYDFLPLGFKTLHKIINIIRDEMNSLGAFEMQMSALQSKELWEATDRWSDEKVDVWFKTSLQSGSELGLGFTHEEPFTAMMRRFISSYKDLPVLVYQFQRKFRNELRAKSGIMRTREFIMKDLYSFARDEKEQQEIYNKVSDSYVRIFQRLGLHEHTYKTFASGGVFSKYSHEFQTLTEAGEDIIYVDKDKKIAVNEEVLSGDVLEDLRIKKEELEKAKASEVGNIFNLGTRFSEPLGLYYKNESGQEIPVYMGSYGIGPARVFGVIVELFSDDDGLVLPLQIAPFAVYIISINQDEKARKLYDDLQNKGFECILDDRSESVGTKLKDADLLGIPFRVVVSDKSLQEGGFELKERKGGKTQIVSETELLHFLNKKYEKVDR